MPDLFWRNAPFLLSGLATTLAITAITAIAGTALAIPLALTRHARIPVLTRAAALTIALIQGTPLLVVLLLCTFAIPALTGIRIPPTPACIAGFSLFLAAYAAEDLRAGLRAIPPGIPEAARALGLTRHQTTRLLTLPLAIRATLPALVGQYVRMLKYTSVASILGVSELTGSALLVNARLFQPLPILGAVALTYLTLCLSLSLLARRLEAKIRP